MEDEIDLQLKQLALEAQQHPAGSKERQIALTRLMHAIERSNRLVHPYRNSWPSDVYEELYSEARVRIFEYICQKIDTYDSQRPVMGWVNHFLNWRFLDVVDRHINQTKIQLFSLDDLEKFNFEQEEWKLYQNNDSLWQFMEKAEELRAFIEEDPNNHFRNTTLRGRPDITWQVITLARLDDETWDTISQKFGKSISTLQSFFDRNLRNFGDDIRNNLQ